MAAWFGMSLNAGRWSRDWNWSSPRSRSRYMFRSSILELFNITYDLTRRKPSNQTRANYCLFCAQSHMTSGIHKSQRQQPNQQNNVAPLLLLLQDEKSSLSHKLNQGRISALHHQGAIKRVQENPATLQKLLIALRYQKNTKLNNDSNIRFELTSPWLDL